MRKKFNVKFSRYNKVPHRSHIYLKYRNLVEVLLTPSIDAYTDYQYDDLYIEHEYARILKGYLKKREIDNIAYLTGLTGTGKTSLLKHVFRHIENEHVIINEKTLVIPFTCDNALIEVKKFRKRLTNLFFAITKKLCVTNGVEPYNKNHETINDFMKYVEERCIPYTVNQKGWRELSNEEILDQIYEEDDLELAVLAFKYTMKQPEIHIDNVVFIMDDVESVGTEKEAYPIYLANKIRACLMNRSRMEKEKWSSTVLIGCRHYIYRILLTKVKNKEDDFLMGQANIKRTTMESFPQDDNFGRLCSLGG